jgi:hypothetical protein
VGIAVSEAAAPAANAGAARAGAGAATTAVGAAHASASETHTSVDAAHANVYVATTDATHAHADGATTSTDVATAAANAAHAGTNVATAVAGTAHAGAEEAHAGPDAAHAGTDVATAAATAAHAGTNGATAVVGTEHAGAEMAHAGADADAATASANAPAAGEPGGTGGPVGVADATGASRALAKSGSPAYKIALKRCPDCSRAWQYTGGRDIEVAPAVLELAACDAVHLGSLDAAVPERATTTVTPRKREQVLARDRYCCTVPGCRRIVGLDLHHVDYQSHGGGHELSNLITLCDLHHRAVHFEKLVIRGAAPDRLTFEFRKPRDRRNVTDDDDQRASSALYGISGERAEYDLRRM